MPQLSPLWFINTLSWSFAIISFLVWYNQAIILPSILRLNLSRTLMKGPGPLLGPALRSHN